MIASLKGLIGNKTIHSVEIEVQGVGYLVQVGRQFLSNHLEGETVKVVTYLAVSENDMVLFGFENYDDLAVFKLLVSVSGVGPKTAMGMMGEATGEQIIKAIGEADVDFFQKIKGIGKKTAQRIIVDLKSKIGGLGELDLSQNETTEDEVVMSLKQLGFGMSEIQKVMQKMPKEITVLEEKIEWCLKNLG